VYQFSFVKKWFHRKAAKNTEEKILSIAGERPAIDKLCYPPGNHLAGGPARVRAGFEQSRLSGDCSKIILSAFHCASAVK
jgi:hypothetical protein